MHILVCGGAGYLGSHMARWLALRGTRVTVLDDLSTGHRAAVQWGELIEADLRDADALDRAFAAGRFDAVMHFCAKSLVAESVADPLAYYATNVGGTLSLLQAMRRHGVERLSFRPPPRCSDIRSRSASTKRIRCSRSILRRHQGDGRAPARRCRHGAGVRSVALRYFNAAGAADDAASRIARPGDAPGPHVCAPRWARIGPAGSAMTGRRRWHVHRDYVHVDDLGRRILAWTTGAHRVRCIHLGTARVFQSAK